MFLQLKDNRKSQLRILPGSPPFVSIQKEFGDRLVKRYLWRCVERGRENEGVKILNVPMMVHKQIVEAIVDTKIQLPLTRWQKFCQWMSNWRGFGWMGRFVPPAVDITDIHHGSDLYITRVKKSNLDIPTYEVGFYKKPMPAGTPQQIAKWQERDVLSQEMMDEG